MSVLILVKMVEQTVNRIFVPKILNADDILPLDYKLSQLGEDAGVLGFFRESVRYQNLDTLVQGTTILIDGG